MTTLVPNCGYYKEEESVVCVFVFVLFFFCLIQINLYEKNFNLRPPKIKDKILIISWLHIRIWQYILYGLSIHTYIHGINRIISEPDV